MTALTNASTALQALQTVSVDIFQAFILFGVLALAIFKKPPEFMLFLIAGLLGLFISLSWLADYLGPAIAILGLALYMLYKAVLRALSDKGGGE